MRYWIFLFFFVLCPRLSIGQNEQLIKDIEGYILKIDSLISVYPDSIVCFHGDYFGTCKKFLGIRYSCGSGSDYSYSIRTISELGIERDRGILYHYTSSGKNRITKKRTYYEERDYFENRELVATIREWKESGFLQKDKITKIVVYVNNKKSIWHKTTGNTKKEKEVRVRLKKKGVEF